MYLMYIYSIRNRKNTTELAALALAVFKLTILKNVILNRENRYRRTPECTV